MHKEASRPQPSSGQQLGQKPYLIGIVLNLTFVLGELIFAKLAHSTALFADAFHNLSDVLALVIAWLAVLVFGLKATKKTTYGFHNVSILASLFNTILLLFAVFWIFYESIRDLCWPPQAATNGTLVTIVAAAAIVVNLGTAFLFKMTGTVAPDGHHHGQDLNAKTAYLHLLADAGVSIGVIVAGWLIQWTGIQAIDPLVSLLIGFVILYSSWSVMKETLTLAVNGVPAAVDEEQVQRYLTASPAVLASHDLHIWPLSTTETALTVHLLVADGLSVAAQQQLLNQLEQGLKQDYHIAHVTIQLELGGNQNCNAI
ncbi:cation diffusion facilitator family transporter [Leuconostocaceae bacterium ESL0958]|nr:cation diffusion facilitator family transporter [Leuconostocaceae bacterium ESL0958]